MSEPKSTYVPCPACRGLSYTVRYEHRANVAHILCSGCNRELISVTMAPPEEPINPSVAPI